MFKSNFSIEFTPNEADIVCAALNEMPAKFSYRIIKRFEQIESAQEEQGNKPSAPPSDLRLVSKVDER